jgi:Zn-dependent M28 family amino/carboxypeptidase
MSRSTISKSVPVAEIGAFIHSRINTGLLRVLNRSSHPTEAALPLDDVRKDEASPIGLSRLLIGRSNEEREAAVAWYLERRGIPFARHSFTSFEGHGENFSVDIGSGDRVLVLIAHHDAVPGSPGANDNAVAVGILLSLLERIEGAVPPGLRVRLLFTAAEELFYLGARAYVRDNPIEDIVGVLSLELCGIGDSVAVWDVPEEGPFLGRIRDALEGLGRRNDETYHVVGRIPVFGSDHRPFANAGIPAYGLSIVPGDEAKALRQFVLSPARSALVHLIHRPPPFDTYHSNKDGLATLEPAATDAAAAALEAIIRLA